MPAVEARTTPPKPGFTRVVIDANGEAATVREVLASGSSAATMRTNSLFATATTQTELTKPLCLTPCVADLEPGLHLLRFESQDGKQKSDVPIQLTEQPKVVRHAMGRTDDISGFVVSGTGFVVGLATAGAGAILLASSDNYDDQQAAKTALLIGGAIMLVTLPFMYVTKPVHQPGSTTQFTY